jgi:hypothetical protein
VISHPGVKDELFKLDLMMAIILAETGNPLLNKIVVV